MRRNQINAAVLAVLLLCMPAMQTYAMDAPGRGDPNWNYDQKTYQWSYTDQDGSLHTGWLFYEGEWYWFDSFGSMRDGGVSAIDGVNYYFYGNGQMAYQQYVGLQYYGEDGQRSPEQDIRVIGDEAPTSGDRDMITDDLYLVPRDWLAQLVKDGWQMMFYKKKPYFSAPNTDLGIYYVRHSVDYNYKKIKFTDTEDLLAAVGEYIGYKSGCYKEGDERMQTLLKEQVGLNVVLNIPDYYSGDNRFYFGQLFSAYLGDDRDEVRRISPVSAGILEDILHEKDADPSYYQKQKEQEAQRLIEEQKKTEALGGPGVKKDEQKE